MIKKSLTLNGSLNILYTLGSMHMYIFDAYSHSACSLASTQPNACSTYYNILHKISSYFQQNFKNTHICILHYILGYEYEKKEALYGK